MLGRKRAIIKALIKELDKTHQEKAEALHQLMSLEATRIRYSVPTELGYRPVYDAPLINTLLMSKFTGGQGIEMPAGFLELVTKYASPAVEYAGEEDGD
jgi:hypothetical protein